jgi:outer membrane biogenesis lipoprotein LolB
MHHRLLRFVGAFASLLIAACAVACSRAPDATPATPTTAAPTAATTQKGAVPDFDAMATAAVAGRVPSQTSFAFFESLQKNGIFGVRFNQGETGWFSPMGNLREIHTFLKKNKEL